MSWKFAICGLLAVNVAATLALALAANDGETQVIPAYYEQAAHYDDALAQAERNRELGWRAAIALDRDGVQVAVHDARGASIDGAHVTISGYQRAHAGSELALALVAVGGGIYRGATHARPGVHDVTVTVERGNAVFTQRVELEVR